jgi:hypothetical protein
MWHEFSVLEKKECGDLCKGSGRFPACGCLKVNFVSKRKEKPLGMQRALFLSRYSRPKLALVPDLLQFNFNHRLTGTARPISGSVTLFSL